MLSSQMMPKPSSAEDPGGVGAPSSPYISNTQRPPSPPPVIPLLLPPNQISSRASASAAGRIRLAAEPRGGGDRLNSSFLHCLIAGFTCRGAVVHAFRRQASLSCQSVQATDGEETTEPQQLKKRRSSSSSRQTPRAGG